MMYLRHVTSSTVMVGPFVGSDGVALTGLTLTQSTFMFSKNGAAFTAKNETTNGSHRIMGYYSIMVDSSDLNTSGRLLLVSSAQNALPVRQEFTVLPTSVYDALITGADLLQADLTQIDGQNTSGNNATLNLKQLNIVNNAGDAMVAQATGANGYGMRIAGQGTAHGAVITGGESGGCGFVAQTGSDGVGVGIQGRGQYGIYGVATGSFAFAGIAGDGAASLHSHAMYLVGGLRGSGLKLFSGAGSAAAPYGAFDTYGIGSYGIGLFVRGEALDALKTLPLSGGYAVSSETGNNIADAILKRNFGSVSGASDRSTLNALRVLRNRVTTSGMVTVYAENDTTAVWTAAITVDSLAGPIVEADPA